MIACLHLQTNIQLITGWILGKGPCGSNCSRKSICKSTLATRALLESKNHSDFGNYSTDYQNGLNSITRDITTIVKENMTENVIAVSESGSRRWQSFRLNLHRTL